MKAILVDDEPKARRILQNYLEEYTPAIEVVATAGDVPEAIKAINKLKPNLVFLDIDMPGENGFALFDYFDTIPFQVIFVTASRDHAIQAFKVSALDYILKPIEINHLIKAVEKAQKYTLPTQKEQVNLLNNNLNGDTKINRIAISLADSIRFIKSEHIIFLKADGPYTEIYLDNGEKIISSKQLGDYDILEQNNFFMKTHRSYIINLHKVESYEKDSGGYIKMQGKETVNLSRYKKNEFLEAMSKL